LKDVVKQAFGEIVLPVGVVGHADPGVGVVEGAVEEPSVAGRLLGAEQALEAGVRFGDLVVGAKQLKNDQHISAGNCFEALPFLNKLV